MKWKPKQLKYRKLQQLTGEISVSQPFYTCDPVSSEISDFTPGTHAQSNILHTKYAGETDY